MAFPTLVSITETIFSSDVTDHAVTIPAAEAGDLLLIIATNDHSDAISTPSGWTSLYVTDAAMTALTGRAYAKLLTSSASQTTVNLPTGTAEMLAAQVWRISGWYGNISDGIAVGTFNTGTTTHSVAALSPAWGSADNLWIAALHTSSSQTVSTSPSGYGDLLRTDTGGGSTADAIITTVRKNVTASSDDPGSFTLSGSGASRASGLIAIRPSAATTTTLSPSSGSASAVGAQPAISQTKVAEAGTLNATGTVPSLSLAILLGPGLLSAVGAQPTVATTLIPTSGLVHAVGNTPDVIVPTQLSPDSGLISFTGNAPSLTAALVPASGAVSAAGSSPAITAMLAPSTGAASAAGQAPALALEIFPTTGLVTAAGSAPSLSYEATQGVAWFIGNQPALTSYLAPTTALISATGEPDSPPLVIQRVLTNGWVVTASGSEPTLSLSVSPTSAAVTAAGNAPAATLSIAPAAGSALASGSQPAASLTLNPPSGSAIASGNTPVLATGTALVPQTGLVSAIGNVPELDLPDPAVLTPPSGASQFIGNQPSLALRYVPTPGRAPWIGARPTLLGGAADDSICTPPLLNKRLRLIDAVSYLM